MTTKITIVGWLLMTVMHSGQMKTAQFPTEALCKDGESLSRYGKTVAEVDHEAMISRAAQEVDTALWELNNPRHEPSTDDEWKIVCEARDQPDTWQATQTVDGQNHLNKWPREAGSQYEWEVFEDGTIKKREMWGSGTTTATSWASAETEWITTTRCVPIPEDQK